MSVYKIYLQENFGANHCRKPQEALNTAQDLVTVMCHCKHVLANPRAVLFVHKKISPAGTKKITRWKLQSPFVLFCWTTTIKYIYGWIIRWQMHLQPEHLLLTPPVIEALVSHTIPLPCSPAVGGTTIRSQQKPSDFFQKSRCLYPNPNF